MHRGRLGLNFVYPMQTGKPSPENHVEQTEASITDVVNQQKH